MFYVVLGWCCCAGVYGGRMAKSTTCLFVAHPSVFFFSLLCILLRLCGLFIIYTMCHYLSLSLLPLVLTIAASTVGAPHHKTLYHTKYFVLFLASFILTPARRRRLFNPAPPSSLPLAIGLAASRRGTGALGVQPEGFPSCPEALLGPHAGRSTGGPRRVQPRR